MQPLMLFNHSPTVQRICRR